MFPTIALDTNVSQIQKACRIIPNRYKIVLHTVKKMIRSESGLLPQPRNPRTNIQQNKPTSGENIKKINYRATTQWALSAHVSKRHFGW